MTRRRSPGAISCRRTKGALRLAVLLLLASTFAPGARAQWQPSGALKKVLVVDECDETGGDVMVSRLDPPTIYICPRVVALVKKRNPGAEHFFYVHEFGHIALQTSDESLADCWAARALADAPHGRRYLDAAIALFRERPDDASARYGAPSARAERIRSCAEEARPALFAPPSRSANRTDRF